MSRSLALYLLSRFCTGVAVTLVRAAMLWHMWRLTHSEAMVGALGIVMVIPGAGLALVGGALADARDRRAIIQVSQLVGLGTALALVVASRAGALTAGLVYASAAALAASRAFEGPARAALLAQVVDRDALPRAITWSSTIQALSFATGPALAGVVIATVGVDATYGLNAALLLMSLLLLFGVDIVVPAARRAASWAAVKEGLIFVKESPVLLGCMTLDLVAVVLGGANALLPIFADDVLFVGAEGYGVLAGALEVGALLMSIVLLRVRLVRAGPLLLGAVVIYGVGTLGFGLSTSFPLSVGLLALCGAADQVSVVLRQNAVQLSTPDELRGRVSAVNMIFIIASNQLSIVESGVVAALIGAQAAVVVGGVGVVITAVIVAVLVPALRAFRFS